MAKRTIHIKSPEYVYKTLCGLRLRDVEYTTQAGKANCKRCKQVLKTYK